MRGRWIRWGLPLLLIGVAGVGAAMAATTTSRSSGTVMAAKSKSFGMILVNSTGRTLYRYTVDSKGVNRCTGDPACGKFWPPMLIKSGVKPTVGTGATAALVGTIKAAHGMQQVTYAGFPLYMFSGDKASGQTKGQGFETKWYVVNGKGALVKHAVAATASTKSTSTKKSAWG
jgi:predicted lipoprotein with Yx(FWY)xxD motif